jgi:hypothetical protein
MNSDKSFKIDVGINVYGKPWQTLVSLKSLLNVSGQYIDKIFFIEEKVQPYNDDVRWVIDKLDYKNTEYFKPKHHLWIKKTSRFKYRWNADYRNSLRYQYAIENTDKKYLLIIHNDIIFDSDIIKPFLDNIQDCFAIGQIGQCWNCPMFYESICDGFKYNDVKFTYQQAKIATQKYPESRTFRKKELIDKKNPKLMPECRINEWCCLVDMDLYRKMVIPKGNVLPFGGYFRIDIADEWFSGMIKNGYKPKYYDIYQNIRHGYFSNSEQIQKINGYRLGLSTHNGHSALSNQEKYINEELEAELVYNSINKK